MTNCPLIMEFPGLYIYHPGGLDLLSPIHSVSSSENCRNENAHSPGAFCIADVMLLSINSLHNLYKQGERNYHSFQFADGTICNAQREQELA